MRRLRARAVQLWRLLLVATALFQSGVQGTIAEIKDSILNPDNIYNVPSYPTYVTVQVHVINVYNLVITDQTLTVCAIYMHRVRRK